MTTSETKPTSRRSVYVASAVCAIGALLFGYDTGVISGALLYLKGPMGIADNAFLQGLVTSSLLVGAMLGALTSGGMAARWGRRAVTLFAACRSEEHTSELQSRENLVCRLLLEKKKCYK